VIPPAEHSIQLDSISENAISVVKTICAAGYEAYLVGGCVRDLLLGLQPKDFDVATSATPEQVQKLFPNCRLIGRRFRLAHIYFRRQLIEVATFRGAANEENEKHVADDGRILRDNVYGTLDEDAIRRDLTVNALYYDVNEQTVIDLGEGVKDLEARTIKMIGDPATRFREDPVRMLRAARFSAKLQFEIEPETKGAIFELADLLENISSSRLFDETKKIFLSGYAKANYQALMDYQLFGSLFPQTQHRLDAASEGIESDKKMLDIGIHNTDLRVEQGKPVTPAFLYALLLWPEVRYKADYYHKQESMSKKQALDVAGSEVSSLQLTRTSLPRRFSLPMREIWSMQPWFEQKSKPRVNRLVCHPRFRAAYDFLLLRAEVGQADKALADWWTQIQEQEDIQELQAQSKTKNDYRSKSTHRRPRKKRRNSNH